MKRGKWVLIAMSLLCVLALAGCDLLSAINVLTYKHDSKNETPLSFTTSSVDFSLI